MNNYPTPITPENFPQAWEFVAEKLRKSKVSRIAGNLVVPAGNILFLACSVVLSFGLIYTKGGFALSAFLRQLPYLPDIWTQYAALLRMKDVTEGVQWAVYVLGGYVTAFIPCLILSGLVHLIYRPKAPALPEESDAKNAVHLRSIALAARSNSLKNHSSPTVCIMLFFLTIFAGLAAYVFGNPGDVNAGVDQMSILIYTMTLFVGYSFFNYVFQIMLRPLYYCKVDKALIGDTHRYFDCYEENVREERLINEIEQMYRTGRSK